MAAAAAALMEMDALVESFLLRIPPEDPASLVRATLVCKHWRRILADPGFRRRYCKLHRRPPMLGFFTFLRYDEDEAGSSFTPTSSFRPRVADFRGLYAIDSRHGRVLLASSPKLRHVIGTNLAVWDPVSGDRLELPRFPIPQLLNQIVHWRQYTWSAAVLCGSNPNSSCDSIGCHCRGHFRVVVIVTTLSWVYVFVYSSQAGTWSETSCAAQDPLDVKYLDHSEPSVLAGNALYFKTFIASDGILKYDLAMQEISWINLPCSCTASEILLTTSEYGGFGIARVESSRLHLWSEEAGPDGHLGWAPSRVIELNTVLPANTHSIRVVAFLHGLGAFLVSTNNGVFSVDLESSRARKVCDEDSCGMHAVPYMDFYTPALGTAFTGEEASVGASGA